MHNYLKKIMDLQEEGKVANKPGAVESCLVLHDDWCAIYKGGECNCNPEIRVGVN